MQVKLTKNESEEVQHKLGILADEPELQEDYKLTQEQADALLQSVPVNGGDWTIPDWAIEAVKGEMQDHAVVLRAIADDAHSGGKVGQSLSIHKQAARFEEKFK